MAIKWRPQDLKKIGIYVQKFNAAITRFERSAPELVDSGVIPERMSSSELKSRILTRNDFNRELRKIDRFFKPGARELTKDESGYYTTKWQQKELRYLEQRINRQQKEFIKKYKIPKDEVKFLGLDEINLTKSKKRIFSKAAKEENLEDKLNTLQEWYNILYTMEREGSNKYLESKFATLRNAYFKAIREHLPDDKAEELIEYLKENDIYGNDIVYAISINDVLDFDYFYNLEEEEARAEIMLDRWKKVMPKIKESEEYKKKKKKKEK